MEGPKQKGHGSLRLLPHQDLHGLSFFVLRAGVVLTDPSCVPIYRLVCISAFLTCQAKRS
jgi:hypothetical protein